MNTARLWSFRLAWASIAGLLIGVIGPWGSIPSIFGGVVTVNGLAGDDGKLLLGATCAVAVFLLLARSQPSEGFGFATLIFGLIALGAAYDAFEGIPNLGQLTGWGLFLCVIAATLGFIASCIAWIVTIRSSQQRDPSPHPHWPTWPSHPSP